MAKAPANDGKGCRDRGVKGTGRIRALFFDLDGTLLDSQFGIAKALRRAFDELGIKPAPDEDEIARHVGPNFDDMVLSLGYSPPQEELERLRQVYRYHIWGLAPSSSPPYDGVPQLLHDLGELKKSLPEFTVGVVTNKETALAVHILASLELLPALDLVQGLEQGLRPKPAPDLVLRAVDRAGVAPREALLIGDTAGDLLAARAAGTRSCLAAYGYGADGLPCDLTPDLRIDHPSQLLPWLRARLSG